MESGLNFIDFLSYGAIGIALALAILSYRLLSKEQDKEQVRQPMLNSIRNYFILALILSVFFGAGEIVSLFIGGNTSVTDGTIEEIWQAELSDYPDKTLDEKKIRIYTILKSGQNNISTSECGKMVSDLNQKLKEESDKVKELETSFYVSLEKFRRVALKSNSWVYLKSRNVDNQVFEAMEKVFDGMAIQLKSDFDKNVLTDEWVKLKSKWSKNNTDHIESSDFPQLVKQYLLIGETISDGA